MNPAPHAHPQQLEQASSNSMESEALETWIWEPTINNLLKTRRRTQTLLYS